MKWVFFAVVMLACTLLGAAVVVIDHGGLLDSAMFGLGALLGFLVAYRMQSRFSILDE